MTTKKATPPHSEATAEPAAAAPKPARRRAAAPKRAAEGDAVQHAEVPVEQAPVEIGVAAPVIEDKPEKDRKGKNKDKPKDKDKKKKRHKKSKEAVLIRFEDDQLTAIDESAAALGLSRAAWVRMVVAKALGKKTK